MAVKTCQCPLDAVIPDLIDLDCPAKFGQIGKIAFQQVDQPFTDITDQSEWIAAIAASDDTKVQMSPIVHNQEATPAEPTVVGGAGSNEVYNGTVDYIGEGFYQMSFDLRNPTPQVLDALAAYECETSRIGVYLGGSDFVLSNGDGAAIEISSFFIQKTPVFNGNVNANISQMIFVFKRSDWFSKGLVNPIDFDFTSLVNA